MKRTMIPIMMAVALVLAFGSQAVFAQAAGGLPGQSPTIPPPGSEKPMGGLLGEKPMKSESPMMAVPRAGEIIGLAVINDQHEDLGKVEDLIVGSDGRISYLVVSKGGVMGFGDKLYPIPWQASNPRIHERALIVNISKNRIENAPSFAGWNEFKKGGYESRVRAYYGEGSGLEGQQGKPMGKEQPMEKPAN